MSAFVADPLSAEQKPFWDREDVTLTYRDRRVWLVEVNGPSRVAIAIDGVSNIVEIESRQLRVQFDGRDMSWEEANERFDVDDHSPGQSNELSSGKRNTELERLLAASTLTPGRYSPSRAVKTDTHAAVFIGDHPVILTGPADDAESVRQAVALAKSTAFQHMVDATYGIATLRAGTVDGASIEWFEGMSALVSKPPGQQEDGTGQGPLVAILTAEPKVALALATALSINTETTRIFDPNAPEFNDGKGPDTALGTSETRAATAVAAVPVPQASTGIAPAKPRDFRQEITDKMIAALEAGESPWKKPWRQSEPPMNGLSGHRYQGINRFMTMLTMFERGYSDPRWLTFKQVHEIGGHIKKGERGVPIEVWKPRSFWERKGVKITLDGAKVRVFDEGPEGVAIGAAGYSKRPTTKAHPSSLTVEHNGKTLSWHAAHKELDTYTARVYTIFNVEQCEGLDLEKLKPLAEQGPPIDAHTRGEFLMAAMRADGVRFQEGGDSACYATITDTINSPARDRFVSQEAYYATVLHEIGHATGAAHRLNRDGIIGGHIFGSEGYAREELRAELASAFLSAETGIGLDRAGDGLLIEQQHKAYLQNWAKVLKSDKNEFFRAAKEAGEAADYVLARERELEQALEHAGLTPRQTEAIEAVCAKHDLQLFAGVIDGPEGELLRVECSASGGIAFRDPETRAPLVMVPSRREDLLRALRERYQVVREEGDEEEAESDLGR